MTGWFDSTGTSRRLPDPKKQVSRRLEDHDMETCIDIFMFSLLNSFSVEKEKRVDVVVTTSPFHFSPRLNTENPKTMLHKVL